METIFEYQGLHIKIEKGVYEPSDDTYLLAENLKVKSEDVVLELGTGSGLIALLAARTARKVVATDISPIAVECASSNVSLNQLTNKVEIRLGNLFEPIREGEKFDLIIFNPPYLPENNKPSQNRSDWLGRAWDGGKSGRNLIDPFIVNCKRYLNSAGLIQMVQSSLSNISKSSQLFKMEGFHVEISAQKSFFFEKLVLLNGWLENK